MFGFEEEILKHRKVWLHAKNTVKYQFASDDDIAKK